MTYNDISDLKLEKYVLGELPETEQRAMDNIMKSDRSLAARYESILASNTDILSNYPPEGVNLQIQWKYNREKARDNKKKKVFAIRLFSFAGAFLSLIFLLFTFIPREGLPFYSSPDNEVVRAKGEAAMKIYRKTTRGAQLLSSGTSVKSGSVYQIKYFAAEYKYGTIFSIDGNSYLTPHFPGSRSGALVLDQGSEVALSESFQLDDAPGFERFFFITSKEPFDLFDVLEKGYELAENPVLAKTELLQLPEYFKQQTFILLKEGL